MEFFETYISNNTRSLRQRVFDHQFWKKIQNGTLEKKYLQTFILQDYWLVKQARKIDTLTISSMKSPLLANLLIQRLPKEYTFQTLFDFGHAIGLQEKDFMHVTPLAGCMALATFFFWMIDNTGDFEKIAAIDASKEVFSTLAVQVQPALKKYYHLQDKHIAFFTLHKNVGERLKPVEARIAKISNLRSEKNLIDQAIQKSYEYELMFYDAVLSAG